MERAITYAYTIKDKSLSKSLLPQSVITNNLKM